MIPQEIGRVVHFTPGRLRFRIERSRRTSEVYGDLRGLLTSLPGIMNVDITPATGSVLVGYDPTVLDVAHLLRLGAELGWIPLNDGGSQQSLTDWRTYVDLPRASRALTILGVAGLGALAAPAIGVSARVGSLTASIGYVALRRWLGSARRGER